MVLKFLESAKMSMIMIPRKGLEKSLKLVPSQRYEHLAQALRKLYIQCTDFICDYFP